MIIDLHIDRKCTEGWGFIEEYLKYTEPQESPTDFHLWCAIGIVSAAMGRNCYLDRKFFKLFPNLYIVLVAESGMLHKSTATGLATRLFQEIVPERRVFAQKATTEAMIGFLNAEYKKVGSSMGFLHASEFSVFFGKSINDPTILQTLTDWYDCPEHWRYETKARDVEEANKIAVTMLAGTTPEWIRTSLPADALGGGFGGRLVFVHRDKTDKAPNPFPEDSDSPESIQAKENCMADLRQIADLRGQFTWTPRGKSAYQEWYEDIYVPGEKDIHSFKGYYARKRDTMIKLAMILSASQSDSLLIDEVHIGDAMRILGDNEEQSGSIADLVEENTTGRMNQKILSLIARHGTINKTELARTLAKTMNSMEMDRCLEMLIRSGTVQYHVETVKGKTRHYYTYHGGNHE